MDQSFHHDPQPHQPETSSTAGGALEVSFVADTRTAARLARAMALARWRSPAGLAFIAAIPLILMFRRLFDVISNARQSNSGVLGILGVYFGLLAVTVIIGAVVTGVQMVRRPRQLALYASAGMAMTATFTDEAVDVRLVTGSRRIFYSQIREVFPLAGAVWLRPVDGTVLALPGELFPPAAIDRVGRRASFRGTADLSKPIGVGVAAIGVAVAVLIAVTVAGTDDDSSSDPTYGYSTTTTTEAAPTTPAFEENSLNFDYSDRTPITTQALLPATFTDARRVQYTLRAAGVHSCDDQGKSQNVKTALAEHNCSAAVTGSYIDQSDQIMVSVIVLVFPAQADATAAYDFLDGHTQDWTIWCPHEGLGSEVCDSNTSYATTRGWSLPQHRYLFHSTSLYLNLSSSDSAIEWLDPAGREAVMKVGPDNHWNK